MDHQRSLMSFRILVIILRNILVRIYYFTLQIGVHFVRILFHILAILFVRIVVSISLCTFSAHFCA